MEQPHPGMAHEGNRPGFNTLRLEPPFLTSREGCAEVHVFHSGKQINESFWSFENCTSKRPSHPPPPEFIYRWLHCVHYFRDQKISFKSLSLYWTLHPETLHTSFPMGYPEVPSSELFLTLVGRGGTCWYLWGPLKKKTQLREQHWVNISVCKIDS